MEQDRLCKNCNVEISSDLCNCPLCGKHIGKNNVKKCNKNERSYPFYNLKTFETARWYNIIRSIFWIIGIICIIVNLVFRTEIYWFPYVLAGLVMVFHVFIEPIKVNVASYIKSLSIMSVLMAIFVIFIDAYNHYSFGSYFGWALAYVAPFVMFAGVVSSAIICLSSSLYEEELLRRITFLAVLSIIYFLIKIIWFKTLATWPSLVFMCTSLGLLVLIELFKRNKLIKELSKEFHI